MTDGWGKRRSIFSAALKKRIVEEVAAGRKSIEEIAADNNICRKTVSFWFCKYAHGQYNVDSEVWDKIDPLLGVESDEVIAREYVHSDGSRGLAVQVIRKRRWSKGIKPVSDKKTRRKPAETIREEWARENNDIMKTWARSPELAEYIQEISQ